MWSEIFRNGQPAEIAQILLLLAGIGFVLLTPFVWIFGRIIALKELPDRRALLTASASYAGASLIFNFGSDGLVPPLGALLAPLPGAVVVFFWLRYTYRKAWIDDDSVPDGVPLENSDWRIGVVAVVGAIVVAAIRAAFIHAGR